MSENRFAKYYPRQVETRCALRECRRAAGECVTCGEALTERVHPETGRLLARCGECRRIRAAVVVRHNQRKRHGRRFEEAA